MSCAWTKGAVVTRYIIAFLSRSLSGRFCYVLYYVLTWVLFDGVCEDPRGGFFHVIPTEYGKVQGYFELTSEDTLYLLSEGLAVFKCGSQETSMNHRFTWMMNGVKVYDDH